MKINNNDVDIISEKEKAQFILEVIEKFPEEHKKLLKLRYISCLKMKQIAATLGVSTNTVRKRIDDATKIINELWGIYEEAKINPEKMKEFDAIIEKLDKEAVKVKIKNEDRKSMLNISIINKS